MVVIKRELLKHGTHSVTNLTPPIKLVEAWSLSIKAKVCLSQSNSGHDLLADKHFADR